MRFAAAAALLALSFSGVAAETEHAPEPEGYWTGPNKGAVPASIRGGKVIDTPALIALLKRSDMAGKVVIVDVDSAPQRPAELAPGAPWLPAPHPAIPGAIWIAGAGLGAIPAHVDAHFRERLAQATENDLDRPIVIYCHERCWLSWNAARRAISYGYRNVHWFPDGIEGWRAAGQRIDLMPWS